MMFDEEIASCERKHNKALRECDYESCGVYSAKINAYKTAEHKIDRVVQCLCEKQQEAEKCEADARLKSWVLHEVHYRALAVVYKDVITMLKDKRR